MTTTTTERPRTLSEAQDRIDELEAAGDPVQLKAQLAARDAEIKILKAAGSSQQSKTPGATAGANSQPPAAKSLNNYSLSELARAADEAGLAGDHQKASLYYQAYSERKQAGR